MKHIDKYEIECVHSVSFSFDSRDLYFKNVLFFPKFFVLHRDSFYFQLSLCLDEIKLINKKLIFSSSCFLDFFSQFMVIVFGLFIYMEPFGFIDFLLTISALNTS